MWKKNRIKIVLAKNRSSAQMRKIKHIIKFEIFHIRI